MKSLKLSITRLDGVVATIDAAPKNPDQDLADDPYAVTNAKPTVSVTNVVVPMYAGETTEFSLSTTHSPDVSAVSSPSLVAR